MNPRMWLAFAGVLLVSGIGVSVERGAFQPTTAPASNGMSWSHGRDGSSANAEEHWQKHGAEFPEDHSEMDYVREANAFVHHPPPNTLIKRVSRGDTVFYQPTTNTFAVMDAQGEPRTFFKPDNGIAYWSRQ